MNKPIQLYSEGCIVFTYWNESGTNCFPHKSDNNQIKKQGIIQKVKFDEVRNTFVLNVKTETGFYLCEQEDVIHVDNHPDRVFYKTFNIQFNIGKCKYVINHHNGIKKHADGSKFFDIDIYSNKKKFEAKKTELLNLGYKLTN
jgi:hypothetical protein